MTKKSDDFFYPRQTYIFYVYICYSEGSSHPWIIFFFSFHLPASNRISVGIEPEFCRHRTGILSVSNWNSSGIEPEFCRHRTGILPAIEPFTIAFLPKEWGRNSLKVIQKSRNKTVSSIIIGYRWNAGIFPRCPPVEHLGYERTLDCLLGIPQGAFLGRIGANLSFLMTVWSPG